MLHIVPEKINNFNVYGDNHRLLGIAEGNFPSIEFMTSEVKGAGLAGVVESPAMGHVNSFTITLKWRAITEDFTQLLEVRSHDLDLWGETIGFNASSGEYTHHSIHIFLKAVTKNWRMGNMVVVESQEAETEHECYYMVYTLDGKEQVAIDKYNFVFRVNGYDYLADTRRNIGLM